MLLEHIIYTTAIVLVIGVFYTRYTGKPYHWWIIVFVSFIPDLDHLHHIPNSIINYLNKSNLDSHLNNFAPWIEIGNLHNIFWLIILSICIAGIISYYKQIEFKETLLFCFLGYGVHLVEDFISYPPVYQILYPVTSQPIGINIIPETQNLGFAGTEVLQMGGIFLLLAMVLFSISNMFCDNTPSREEE